MLDTLQNTLVVIVSVALALGFMAIVNRYWPSDKRRAHNDLIGWQLSVLGTTYAVIIGFMLYTVWINYGSADVNTEAEASSLVNIYRLADGLTAPQGAQMRLLARAYGDAVVNQEWLEMEHAAVPNETGEISRRMWQTMLDQQTMTPAQITAEDHALYELSNLAGFRRTRLLQSQTRLPGILWFVLIVGGVVTIASTCLFGAANGALHVIQVGAFAFLIALSLAAVADINRPFQGTVHVSDYAFRRAQLDMKGQ